MNSASSVIFCRTVCNLIVLCDCRVLLIMYLCRLDAGAQYPYDGEASIFFC